MSYFLVKSQMYHTLGSSGVRISFQIRQNKTSKFAPKVDEGFFLVMPQMLTAIASLTKPPVALRLRVT